MVGRSTLRLALWALIPTLAHAQYASEGWKPGQKVDKGIPHKGSGWSPKTGGIEFAPHIEKVSEKSSMESLVQFGMKRVLGYTDEQLEKSRSQVYARISPVFHPKIENITEAEGVDISDILGFGPPGVDEDASVFAEDTPVDDSSGRMTAPWAILISASKSDKDSQTIDMVFNRTVHALYPDPTLGLAQVIDDKIAAEEVDEEDDDDFEIVAGFRVPKQDKQPARKSLLDLLPKEQIERKASAAVDNIEYLSTSRAAAREQLAGSVRENLKDWRFAYMDFYADPRLTWKWWIWKVPIIVIASPSTSKDRLYDLRFYKAAYNKPDPETLLRLLGNPAHWQEIPVWDSSFAPGGSRHHFILNIADFFDGYIYPVFEVIPPWLFTILVAGLASTIPPLLYGSGESAPRTQSKRKQRASASRPQAAEAAAAKGPKARRKNAGTGTRKR